jgi:hypothetical protein
MKYKYFLLSIAGIILIATIIVSCSKQVQTEPSNSSTEITQFQSDLDISKKINAFKSKLEYLRENTHLKSGETIAVDSAVWYIEAASNQTYGDAGTPFGDIVINSFNINVAVSNGEIQYNDILTAYDQMIGTLSNCYNAIPDENKHLVVNDVSLRSVDESKVTLGITAGFGIEGNEGTSNLFDSPWYYGELAGDCNFNYAGTDAAEKIEDKIILRMGLPAPGTYYTSPETVTIYANQFLNPNDPVENDNMYDYLMFRCWDDEDNTWPNVHTCVSIDEMNFYLLGTEEVIYTYESEGGARPAGKSLITINLIGDYIPGPTGTDYMHYGFIQYGIKHIGGSGIDL